MSLSAVKYRDGIEISFSPQCKHFHLLQASEGRGSHICDRSIGPNALGRSNQSPRHAIVGAERRPDPRLFPPPLPQLVPDPPVSVRGPRKKQEPHVSTTTHPAIHPSIHPARQAHLALPHHGRPSIIDEVKCDEVLLRAHKEHTPFFMLPCGLEISSLRRGGTFLNRMFSFFMLRRK